jgi:iron complex transport system permease protein
VQHAPTIEERARSGTRLARGLPYPLPSALLLLALAAGVAITVGTAAIPARTAIALLLNQLPFVALPVDAPAAWERIVLDVRLPRIAIAGVTGAALAYSGAAYQGVFRNPLADPYLLGVASGAGLGAAIAIVSPLDAGTYGFGWVPLCAFAGAAAAVTLAYLFAHAGGPASDTALILAGVAISAVAGAITSFVMLTEGPRAQPIFGFLFGTLNTASWGRLVVGTPYVLLGAAVIAPYGRLLNVLQLDEEQAQQLGVDVARAKLVLLAAASLLAATAVALAGVIGFVGLVVPHVVRLLYGQDYRRLLPIAAITGAAFLIGVDALARTVLRPQEVPVGIVTAIVGGPFFLYVLRARGSRV